LLYHTLLHPQVLISVFVWLFACLFDPHVFGGCSFEFQICLGDVPIFDLEAGDWFAIGISPLMLGID
jgi:hypothetical protein